ncbi:hypothetical protein [Mesorhizobium sp. J428]|uniref:hypothetical protein n=1 Tax=Mesorhizobium sp. J428 TaxID=2898440 RepID=UPI002151BAC3|nr:hypothetical protein [Mesorhizobium sp. J428]MCR5856215.1 hypothetical protein [Mesorhizobium sp. J428]
MNISKEEFPDHVLVQVVGRLDAIHAKSFETYHPGRSTGSPKHWLCGRRENCLRSAMRA